MRNNKVRLVLGALLTVPLLLLAACAPDAPQDTLEPAGPFARQIDSLFRPVFWIAVVVFALVQGLLVYALIRFRHRPGRPVPEQVHGSKRLEIMWTIAPALLLAIIAIPTLGTIFALEREPSAGERLDIVVTAHQFWWEAEYPGLEVRAANEFHVPVGRPVYVRLESDDVIHSFWVPRLAGKRDVIPGQANFLTFQADEPGRYFAQCAEYCGLSHANMRFWVIAEPAGDFEAWVAAQREAARPPPEDVLATMTRGDIGCQGCHTIDGVEGFAGRVGPDLTHLASRETFAGIFPNTTGNLRDWIRNPRAMKPGVIMPVFEDKLSEEEIRALVAYLETLE